jgi:predicted ATP-grasp superfamily ATP-dependent carboligase
VSGIKGLRSPIVIAAFEGWNDAGEAATGATHHLALALETQAVAAINPDDYYDFQVTRPVAEGDYLADLRIIWPTTRLSAGVIPGTDIDLLLIHGIEPNMRWQAFTEELMKLVRPVRPRAVITLAALLADSPHTRPVPVNATVNNPRSAARYNTEHSPAPRTGGGPTGITTVFAKAVAESGLDSILLWGSVPHYAPEPPSPKVTLALLREIQNLLALAIPLGDLPEAARNWERSVDELAAQDVEVMEYVRSLESAL